ncbi:MAG: hypothetical protein ACOYKN_12580, partial [Pirellula sp.]
VLALALATQSTGLSQDLASPGNSDSSEASDSSGANGKTSVGDKTSIGKHRFEPSPAREYLIERARKESEAREELLRHYQAIGFNYAQPTIDGMAMHPYRVKRRWFYVKPIAAW